MANDKQTVNTNWAIPTGQGYEEAQVGFPPFWQPDEKNNKFAGEVIACDREGTFERWVVKATKPIVCYRGDEKNRQEEVISPGQYFTMSTYSGLRLDRYIGMGEIVCFIKGEQKTKNGNTMYIWGILESSDCRKRLASAGSSTPSLKAGDNIPF